MSLSEYISFMDEFKGKAEYVEDKDSFVTIHYYGDYIRKLFFAIGIIMLIGMPLFSREINLGVFIPVLGVLAVNLLAGLTSPRKKIVIFFDALVAFIGTAFFELFAFFRFNFYGDFSDGYFWFNEILAILFFVALYLSIKTFRGMTNNM